MIDTSKLSHNEWLEIRRSSLGGSDVATALGVCEYKSPYMLWLDKTGRFDFSGHNPVADFGNLWEPFARKHFQKVTGFKAQEDPNMYYHPEYPTLLSANIDGRIMSSEGDGILEIKTTTSARIPILAGPEDVPISWRLQIQHYLGITGYEFAYLLVFQRDTARYLKPLRIEADHKLIEANNEQLSQWWDTYVVQDKPPPMSCLDDVKLRWPTGEQGKAAKAAESTVNRYYALKQVEERLNGLKLLRESLQLDIKKAMGDAELLLGEGGQKLASWKDQLRNRFNTARFKENHPKLYKEYINQNKTRVFRLS